MTFNEIEQKFRWEFGMWLPRVVPRIDASIEPFVREMSKNIATVTKTLFERKFQYYDTPSLRLLHEGKTLRVVGGFTDDTYKIDLKQKSGYEREEIRHTVSKRPTIKEIEDIFLIEPIQLQCETKKEYERLIIENDLYKYLVELTHVSSQDEYLFSELEFELGRGEICYFTQWCRFLQEKFNLERHEEQKYTQIMRHLRKIK